MPSWRPHAAAMLRPALRTILQVDMAISLLLIRRPAVSEPGLPDPGGAWPPQVGAATPPNTLPNLSLHRLPIMAIERTLSPPAGFRPLGGDARSACENSAFSARYWVRDDFSPCFLGPFRRKVGKTTAFLGFLPTFGL